MCDYPIDDNIVDLFYNYEKLSYLTDSEENHYQLPIIGYSTCDIKKIDFVATFGIQMENGILGNYYYFTDYENSLRPNYLKYGLIRCVIFPDKTKIIYDLKDPFVKAIPVDIKNIDAEITKLINVNGKAILLMNLFIFSLFCSSGLPIYYNLDKYCITSTILLKEE